MTSRVFAFRLAAGIVFTGLAFGAAPASAQSYYSGCGACGTSYVVPQPRYSYSGSCGGCGTAYVAPQPQYYYVAPQPQYYVAPQPQYYYSNSCGGCGGSAYYAQPQYYAAPAVAADAYETAVETEVAEPEFEQSPVYFEGQSIYRRAGIGRRIHRRVDRRVAHRVRGRY